MAVLYRKYRPQNFAEVLGQKPVTNTLKNQVKRGELSHAYLFTGSRGVGKTSIARILAKAVNCKAVVDGEPCGVCEICTQITQGKFLDLIEIDAASYTGVDNVRDIIEHVKFSPSLGQYKIIIIDEVHMLSKAAFNALLKTLEEPPKHAIFILATTEINKVLPTIISRTQRFDFKALPVLELEKHLKTILEKEQMSFQDGIIQLVAENAEGSVRDSLSLLDKILTLGNDATLDDCRQLLGITDIRLCYELFGMILSGNTENIPEFFDKLFEKGQDLVLFTRDFLDFQRKLLIAKLSQGQITDNEEIVKVSGQVALPNLIYFIRLFLKAYKEIHESPNPAIPLLIASVDAALKQQAGTPASGKVTPKPIRAPVLEQVQVTLKTEEIISQGEVLESREEVGSFGPEVFSTIKDRWMEIADNIRSINSPLANLVKNVQLCGMEGNVVVVGVKFLIHKQSLENVKNFNIINAELGKVTGARTSFRVKVIKDEASAEGFSPTHALTDAIKIFGGELVD